MKYFKECKKLYNRCVRIYNKNNDDICNLSNEKLDDCIDCEVANKIQNYSRNDESRTDGPLRVDFDIVEVKPASLGGATYACPFILSRSRWIEGRILKAKSDQKYVIPQVINIINR